ncbi:Metal-dependent hydrolase, endonuclease/exonuclease/phosphatase family [Actinopolymorpha cephalotaxi]|nr:endonuclease/exonuclease/phosphatase family protein [Actinopolymorpha cephalotaxi]SFG99302.1 Metal-dependent hydrolase, endonuclease/exonuclease/phosphatase family [Actinopolymorpha cephalotaxi]
MTYNVHGLRDDLSALTAVVEDLRPDVLVVQEAPKLLRWRSRCAGFARAAGLLYVAGGRTAGGNLLLAHQRTVVHGHAEERIPQRLRDPIRGVVSATLGVGGRKFGVVGVHLSLSAAGRVRDVDRVLATVRSFGDLPVLVAGDLNEHPGGPSWRALTGAGLQDVAGDGAHTFPAGEPRARIDAVFVSSGGGVRGRAVDLPADDESRARLARASDHRPVVVDVELGTDLGTDPGTDLGTG